MLKNKRNKRKISLRNSIILLSLLLTITFSGIFSFFYYNIRYQNQKDNLNGYLNSASFLMSNFLDERISTVISRVYTIASGVQFQEIIKAYLLNDDNNLYALTATSLIGFISQLRMSDPFISSVYIYTEKGMFYDYLASTDPEFDFLKTDIYKEYKKNGNPLIYCHYKINDPFLLESSPVVPLLIRTNISGYVGEVFVVVNLNTKTIESYLTQSLMDDIDMIIINKNKKLIASSDNGKNDLYMPAFILDDEKGVFSSNDSYLVSGSSLKRQDWTVIAIAPQSVINNMLVKDLYILLIIMISTILVSLIISICSSSRIVYPLKTLQNYMLRVTEGDYNLHFDYNYNNEVGKMAKSFNYMVDRIGSLISELNLTIEQLKVEKENVKQEQLKKRAAELHAYQAEINPHFLYNTLNSIIWLAADKRTDDISLLAFNLAKFYEHRLHHGETIISIGSEIEQVRSYIDILKFRYGDLIQAEFNIDETMTDYLIVKLVIQPLVENSIYHGLQVKENIHDKDRNLVSIRVYPENEGENSDIIIEVYDNGVGMPKNKIEKINSRLKNRSFVPEDSYGVYNVNERIKLYFGDAYGLQYDGGVCEGTRAVIRIPRVDHYDEDLLQK